MSSNVTSLTARTTHQTTAVLAYFSMVLFAFSNSSDYSCCDTLHHPVAMRLILCFSSF
uniref:Uncharacterized protein n=1 Tax=Rhizophora mucronata TaxID=61149 RepID=A0A2P2PR55_RHIMU